MSNTYQNSGVRGIFIGFALFAIVLCAATTLGAFSPVGVGIAYANDGGYEAFVGEPVWSFDDGPSDSGYEASVGEPVWGFDGSGCCYSNDCCSDNFGWGCCYEGSGCCGTYDNNYCCENYGDPCCADYPEYCDYCYVGDYGERYYSSSAPRYSSSYPIYSFPSYSYPSYPSYPQKPITVSSGQPSVTNTNINTTQVTNIDNSIRDSFNTVNYNSGNVGSFNSQAVSGGTGTAIAAIDVTPTTVSLFALAAPVAYAQTIPVYSQPAPYCTITITNNYSYGTVYGQQTLTWYSTDATSANVNPYVGAVPTTGSRTVSYGNQTYTMTVYGPGGSASCQTQPSYIPLPTPTPYVSLSQIPYTGFDYGPVGNALYWISLAAVAIAGAYLVVYFRGGAFAFATSFFGRNVETRKEFTPALPTLETKLMKRAEAVSITPMRAQMTDNMSFVRGANGLPQIVIARG